MYIDRLLQWGVLRRSGPRLYFTYPIVQEYLAARWLVQNAPKHVGDRFRFVVRRPWAQAIQFALETHPDADAVIRDQLAKPDDAFNTVLRLIARCVVNGANIQADLRRDLGDRLASAWSSEGYLISQNIGYLLADGFINPLPEEAVKHIIDGWALHYGGAEIIVAKADAELTQKALEAMLRRDLKFRYYLYQWQVAVDAIAPTALELYLARARETRTKDEELKSLMSLMWELSSTQICKKRWSDIANDVKLPREIRLVALARCLTADYSEAWKLVDELIGPWFSGECAEPPCAFFVLKVFWNLDEAEKHFQALMLKQEAPPDSIEDLVKSLLRAPIHEEHKMELIAKTAELKDLPSNRRFLLQLILAAMGHQDTARSIVRTLGEQSFEHHKLWCFHLGHFSKEAAIEGLQTLRSLSLSAEQFRSLIGVISTGLNYVVEPTTELSGVLDKQYRHPATSAFASWILPQLDHYEFSAVDRLRVLHSASQIGAPNLAEKIPALMEEILDTLVSQEITDEARYDLDWALCVGADLCEHDSKPLDVSLIIRIIETTSSNAARRALELLSRQADDRMIPWLIDLHARHPSEFVQEGAFSALEKLAGRYGKKIIRDGDRLSLQEWV